MVENQLSRNGETMSVFVWHV